MDGAFLGREEIWGSASPMNYLDDCCGRFLVLHGTEDDVVPYSQSERLVAAFGKRGIENRFVPLEGEMHSFTHEGWNRIRSEYTRFIGQRV